MSETHQIGVLIILLWSLIFVQTGKFVHCSKDSGNSSQISGHDLIIPSVGIYEGWFTQTMKKIQEVVEHDSERLKAEKDRKIIKVNQNGNGDFKTIKEAVDSIEDNNTKRVIIQIEGGEYNEKITINKSKPFVTLIGDFVNMPVLAFNSTNEKTNLMDTATLNVEADYFQGANLIIKNTHRPNDSSSSSAKGIALRIKGDAAHFENCTFEAFANTIRDDEGRHFFYDCTVWGQQEIITGNGRSIYLTTDFNVTDASPNCSVAINERKDSSNESGGGFVFMLCHIRSYKNMPTPVFLAKPGAPGSRVIYAYTKITPRDTVNPKRFNVNSKHPEYSKTAVFAEYDDEEDMNHVVSLSSEVSFAKKLKKSEADEFISLDYIQATKWLIPIPTYGYKKDQVLHPL